MPFKLLMSQSFKRSNVDIEWTLDFPEVPDDLLAKQDAYWQRYKQTHFFNGPLVRLNSWHLHETLELELGITNYKSLLYSNAHAAEISKRWGKEYVSHALGVSAAVISQDNWSFVIRKSNQVGEYPGYWDVPGGHIDVPCQNRRPDPFQSICQELYEELNLSLRPENVICIGLIETCETKKPEMLFVAPSACRRDEILKHIDHARDRHEYTDVLPLAVGDLVEWNNKHMDTISPSALAMLQMVYEYVRRAF